MSINYFSFRLSDAFERGGQEEPSEGSHVSDEDSPGLPYSGLQPCRAVNPGPNPGTLPQKGK
ncbi:hypothetical protein DPMN_070045 [Dreissena polymorpha]|uniref:Uncharacterized protein n=1 Tax=Dreissena polymorpha TaxID=45954 RepID=A0A9D3Z2I7_DREPO|nr:hypothetical protein DPMN_070045 [Dreissena polymorpha]